MTQFRLSWPWVLDGSEPPGDLVRALAESTSVQDRDRLLKGLANQAATGDADSVERYAIGLSVAKRFGDSLQLWRLLLKHRPNAVRLRLNLAACLLSAQRMDECARELDECARRCPDDDPLRPMVQQRLEELATIRDHDEREFRLLELKADAYRELAERGEASPADLKELCKVLAALQQRPGSGVTADDVLALAEQAREGMPQDAEVLELVAYGRILTGDMNGLSEMLRLLEQVAPHSHLLGEFRSSHTDPEFQQMADQRKRHMDETIRRAGEGDEDALRELRRESQRFPANETYGVGLLSAVYGRAASGTGDYEEARRIAHELAAKPSAGHHTHFHVAQFLWMLGDHELARHQFARAFETAQDEEDRETVRLAMRTVGADGPEDGRHG